MVDIRRISFHPVESRLQSTGGLKAPLILLAQTRQADRDKVMAMADAQHREDLHQTSEERQRVAAEQTALLVRMLDQNTQLMETAKALAERIESLTAEVHKHIMESNQA
jgi:uncharacterized membrane protein